MLGFLNQQNTAKLLSDAQAAIDSYSSTNSNSNLISAANSASTIQHSQTGKIVALPAPQAHVPVILMSTNMLCNDVENDEEDEDDDYDDVCNPADPKALNLNSPLPLVANVKVQITL